MNKSTFRDHFSTRSEDYKKYRPGYPHALFEYLASISPQHQLAWDCATGSGQVASHLGQYFDTVIASDASAAQIDSCVAAQRVEYRVMPAEHTDFAAQSVDLITVAQALHWFDIERFFDEVKRVLKPAGLLAICSYNLLSINEQIDSIVNHLYSDTLRDYWPPERRLIENAYADIVFPFRQQACPEFSMQADWHLPQLLGYLRTWSATKAFREAMHFDPVAAIADDLQQAWGEQPILQVRWPLTLAVYRNTN